ncbi:hypothetical protein FACS189427_07490 [Planctomycetales bacterium]|nr:hypothetical protein FACS189427_07490 [Planctomycetales bacterium]
MPNYIVFSWEQNRLMLLAARIQGTAAVFEQLEVFQNHKDDGNSEENSDKKEKVTQPLAEKVADYIRSKKWGKVDAAVLLSRTDVEVRSMFFPPVPSDELPDLVRFQAAKEFNAYDPDSLLDFFQTNKLDNISRSTMFPALPSKRSPQNTAQNPSKKADAAALAPAGSPKHILASVLRNNVLKQIQQFCGDINVHLKRIVLRPCESAFLYRKSKQFNSNKTTLLVELDAEETTQTVLFRGEPVFIRSPKIRCPDNTANSDFAARLIAELKRTRMAVRNEIQGVTVDEVVLCGSGGEFETLASEIAAGMDTEVQVFDPWNNIILSDILAKDLQEKSVKHPERFAPFIGTILRTAKNEAGDIDFLCPKKKPEPVGQRQFLNAVIATALLLFICITGYGFYAKNTLANEVKKLSNQRTALERTAKAVNIDKTQLKAVEDWQSDKINWFEELGWLSKKVPDARDMIVTELTLGANRGGSMTLKTLVKDSSVVSPMEERLRDDKHEVKTGEKGEVKGNPLYGFRFDLSIAMPQNTALQNTAAQNAAPQSAVQPNTGTPQR